MSPICPKSTYSANQWTVEKLDLPKKMNGMNDDIDDVGTGANLDNCNKERTRCATACTVHELTKDLMMSGGCGGDGDNKNNDNVTTVLEDEEGPQTQELDWDLGESKDIDINDDSSSNNNDDDDDDDDDDDEEEERSHTKNTSGRRKKKNSVSEESKDLSKHENSRKTELTPYLDANEKSSVVNEKPPNSSSLVPTTGTKDTESILPKSNRENKDNFSSTKNDSNAGAVFDSSSDDDDDDDGDNDDETVAMSDDGGSDSDDMTVVMQSENADDKCFKEILDENSSEEMTVKKSEEQPETDDDQSSHNFNVDFDVMSSDENDGDSYQIANDKLPKTKIAEIKKQLCEGEEDDEYFVDKANTDSDVDPAFDDSSDEDDINDSKGLLGSKELAEEDKGFDSKNETPDDDQEKVTEESLLASKEDANDDDSSDVSENEEGNADIENVSAVDHRSADTEGESVLVTASSLNHSGSRKAKKSVSAAVPKKRELIAATDALFAETEDKTSVTLRSFCRTLEEQHGFKVKKQVKKFVRERIRELLSGKSDEDEASAGEVEESEEEDADDEASLATDPESSDEENDTKVTKARRRKSASKKKTNKRSKRLSKRTTAHAAKVMEVRRKKRMDELKVRNEEMQLNQTKEDEERQEAIAAKFETNSDELRLKRLEDRLDLLQRLDETRISVVEKKDEPAVKMEEDKSQTDVVKDIIKEESSESDESSSEEEDLIIVGMKKPLKPLKPLHNHLPSYGFNLLNEICSPRKGMGRRPKSKSPIQKNKKRGMILSPGRSMGARFALKNALKQKQRKVGNRWLARELGYKTEEDHLKDCKTVAEEKHGIVVKLEQERLKTNERKQLRERIMLQEQHQVAENNSNNDDDNDDEAYIPPAEDSEEDEEMKMAKEIEQEQEGKAKESESLQDAIISCAKDEESNNTKEKHSSIYLEATLNGNFSNAHNKNADISQLTETQLLETQPLANTTEISFKSEVNLNDINIDADIERAESQLLETQPLETQPPDILNSIESGMAESEVSLLNLDSSKKRLTSDTISVHKKDLESFAEEPHPIVLPTLSDDILESDVTESKDDAGRISPVESIASIDPETPAVEKELIITETVLPEESIVTPDKKDEVSDDDEELEFDDEDTNNEKSSFKDPNRIKNAGWQAMLKREADKLKKQKKRKGGLVEEEAEEEEEEEVAGLEDFGFSISKKKKDSEEDDGPSDEIDEDDLKHVVDDVSDDEGDEDAGRIARKRLEQREEKDRHKEILRRMREGYDGRRGGIAGGGNGARGMHRFDQLVAADNRDDAKRLGLLNDDELDSEDEKEGDKSKDSNVDEEEDETAILDKMLKDRFMHRSDIDLEENFSEDEEEEDHEISKGTCTTGSCKQ